MSVQTKALTPSYEFVACEWYGLMFEFMQSNQAVWMRAVTVAAAVMAILVSALAMSPEIDHRVLPTQSAVVSAMNTDVVDDGFAQPAADTNCHIGHSCAVAIMPRNETAFVGFDRAGALPCVADYKPAGATYPLFHPPRVLSQV